MDGIKTTRIPWTLLLITLFFLVHPDSLRAENYYVKQDGTGPDCKRSNPCLFTTAMAKPGAGHNIFFRQGTYTRTASSVLRIEKDLYLYGGWDGNPFGDLVIDPDLYESILDGEGDRPVIHILGARTIVTGFTIQNGNAQNATVVCRGEGTIDTKGCGGGIYVYEAEALIINNKIQNNKARDDPIEKGYGGGLHLERASGTIVQKNLIQDNQDNSSGEGGGGGLFIYGSTSNPPRIIDNHFVRNSAREGGAIVFYDQSNPTITDNVFDSNNSLISAGLTGAGPAAITRNLFQKNQGTITAWISGFQGVFEANRLFNNNTIIGLALRFGSPPYPKVLNNIIAKSGSVAVYGHSSAPINLNFEHNTLVGEGVGTAFQVGDYCLLSLNNNIIFGFPTGIGIMGTAGTSVTARHTLFDLSVTTHGNNVNFINTVTGDPAFKNPAGDDYHIRFTSAARDAGTASFITAATDIDDDPRPIGSAPDIGADEYKPEWYLFLPLVRK